MKDLTELFLLALEYISNFSVNFDHIGILLM